MSNFINPLRNFENTLRKLEEADKGKVENQNRLAGRYDAGEIFEHLMERVKHFQAGLSDEEEVGVKLANFGEAAQIHIRSIGFKNPNLIEFRGINTDNNEVTLIQHISQLNFLLIAMKPIDDEPYRVGFNL